MLALMAPITVLLGCVSPGTTPQLENPESACVALCSSALQLGVDLSDGPCLSTNNPDWEIGGWVCDVAHSPRTEADNLPENQCPEYGETATKFVEVSPECTLLRSVG